MKVVLRDKYIYFLIIIFYFIFSSTLQNLTIPDIDIRFRNEEKTDCNLEFAKVGRYFVTQNPIFHWRNKFQTFLNLLLRKFRLL